MHDHATEQRTGRAAPAASWPVIVFVLVAEIVGAALVALAAGQAYVAWECSDPAFARREAERCDPGFPYPLF